MMYTEPFHATPPAVTVHAKKTKRVSAQTIDFELDDIESESATAKKYQSASFEGLTFGEVTDQIWHFSSVDHGPRCESMIMTRGNIGADGKQIHVSATIHYL
jgi:hypothetical protein